LASLQHMLPAEEMLDTQAQDVPALALGTEQQGRVVCENTGCVDTGILSPTGGWDGCPRGGSGREGHLCQGKVGDSEVSITAAL